MTNLKFWYLIKDGRTSVSLVILSYKQKEYLMVNVLKISLLLIFCFSFFGCKPEKPSIKTEFPKYITALKAILELEEKVFNSYDQLTGEKYVSDADLKNELEAKTIPQYEEFLVELKDIKISIPQLQKMHKKRIELSQKYYKSLQDVIVSIDIGATQKILEARREVRFIIAEIDKWKEDLLELAKDNDVTLPEF